MKTTLPRPIGPSRRPRMEVVVPCYNYGKFLPGCVDSILDQRGIDVVVTIVDDASPDGSGVVADAIAEGDARVSVLHNSTNLGMVGTFNRGVSQVDSDYMLLISADDMVAPGALTRAAALMEAYPTVGLVYGHAQKFIDEPRTRRAFPFETWSIWEGHEWIGTQLGRAWSNISSPEAVVRTTVQHTVGLYDAGLPHTLDVEMWLRIAAVADVGHINGVDQAYYRRQPASYSAAFSAYRDIEERWRAYDQFLVGWSQRSDAAALRPRVRSALVSEALSNLLVDLETGADAETAQLVEVRDLVERIDPGASRSELWSDVETIVDPADGDPTAAYRARRFRRTLARAVKWRRWHRARYFG